MKITAISLVLFGAAVGTFTFVLFQTQSQGEELVMQIEALDAQRAQEESYFRLLRVAEESRAKRELLQSYFLKSEGDSIYFINTVEALAPDMGVELDTSRNTLETVTDKSNKNQWVDVGVAFSGPEDNVRDFLVVLESLPYVSQIISVNLSAQNSALWKAEVILRVRIFAYDE